MRSAMLIGVTALALAAAGCDKDEDPEDVPMETSKAEDDDEDDGATSEPAPSADAPDGGSDGGTAAAPATAAPMVTRPTGASIDACCAALRSASGGSRSKGSKSSRLKQAAGLCSSIAPMVRSGKTSRTTALRQIRAFAGSDTPAACN